MNSFSLNNTLISRLFFQSLRTDMNVFRYGILPSSIQSQLNCSFADWSELALFSINLAAHPPPPTHPPDRESLFDQFQA